jgi:aspartate aminotransferase
MVKSGVEDLLFFTVGEPDFNSPDNVISAMKQALDKGFTGYTPTAGIPELRSAIAEKLKKDNNIDALPQEIMVSTGAKQALYNVTAAITNPGDEFIIPLPYWVSYPEIVKLCGGVNVFAGSPDRIEITLDDIIKKVTPKTKALILNSPSNPSGYVIPPKTIEQIAGYAREKDFYIISDEIYEKLIFRGVHFSPASIMKDRVITINGVSKSYAMTGLRIGYAHGPVNVIKAALKLQGHATSNASSISQYGALEAITGPQDSVAFMREDFLKRRRFFIERLNQIKGFQIDETDATFYVFPKISSKNYNGDSMAEMLLTRLHIASIPGSAFGTPQYIRFSCATAMQDIAAMCQRLENEFGLK